MASSQHDHPWSEKRPSRIKVLGVYSKRALLRSFNSKPYLSGDLFADYADYVHLPVSYRYNRSWWNSLKQAQVIFCPSDHLQDFLSNFSSDINARVIISGNGDHDFKSIPEDIPKSIQKLYLQNSFISDGHRIETLPIGIENLRYGVNGLPHNLKFNPRSQRQNKVLMGPFGLTHPDRIQAFDEFQHLNQSVDLIQDRIMPGDYAKLMSQYKFVASVRGNGVDTHRLWEALYRGCVPLLIEDSWSRSLAQIKIPHRLVNEWSLEEVQETLQYPDQAFNPKSIPSLWWPYWKEKIESAISD